MNELRELIRLLAEWEAADDRANEAAAVLGSLSQLTPTELRSLRALQTDATLKLEAVHRLVAAEAATTSRPGNLAPARPAGPAAELAGSGDWKEF